MVVAGNHIDIHPNAGTIEDIDGQDAPGHDLHLIVLPHDEKSKNGRQIDRDVGRFPPFKHRRSPSTLGFMKINDTNSQTGRLKNLCFLKWVWNCIG